MLAGAASGEITPALGTHLGGSGMGDHRPAQEILDPLFAKAVVFQHDDRRLCIVTLDVIMLTDTYCKFIRSAVSATTGIPQDAIMVHALQNHSAPSIGNFMLDPDFPLVTSPENEYLQGGESAYADYAAARAVQVAVDAANKLQPVRLGFGRALVGDVAFNRRGITRDGNIMMPKPQGRQNQPLGMTNLCYMEGPMDPELGVLSVQNLDEQPVALLLHHTCHPVNVFGHAETYYSVSGDWPGAWSHEMRKMLGQDVVPIVLNGCCGNINPWNPFDPDDIPDHRRMGRRLAEMTGGVLEQMRFQDADVLDWDLTHVELNYRSIPKQRSREVADILAANPSPPRLQNGEVDPRWFLAASTRSVELCRQREPTFAYEIQLLRIADLAVLGLPGEPFVEGQLEIKVRSVAPYLFPAHLTARYAGYLPTRESYSRGGHEVNAEVTYWAKFTAGSLETVTEKAVSMIGRMFSQCELYV